MRHIFLALLILPFTSACSLYQSDGRKFLEKQAFEFAEASANLQSCGKEKMGDEWLKISDSEQAQVYSSENSEFELRVVPLHSGDPFHCTFHFASVQEMVERTDSAVEITLEQMALGLVE